MATLTETASWVAGIYQLETTDPVLGGPDGIDNLQAKQLANRTVWLKEQVETLGSGKQPLDATLTALASVATAADRLIYATGEDTFAVTPLTAFIRTFLDDIDAATARTTLGAASVASPAFSGTPTAPTAAPGSNTQQLATAAFVQAAIAPLAPLASPTFTGDPAAPTPAQFDSDTSLATTAFVQRALGNRSTMGTNITATRNMTLADLGGTFVFNGGSGTPTCVLPDIGAITKPSSLYFYNTGSVAALVQGFGGAQVIAKANGLSVTSVSVPPGGSLTLSTLAGAGGWFPEGGSVANQFDLGSFGASLTNPGWRKLPSGEIEQWQTVTLTAVGTYNQKVIGGTTFYTNYYNITYPMAYVSAVFEAQATLACTTFAGQIDMAGKGISLNLSGTGNPLTGMTIAVTTPNLGEVPTIHWRSRGK